jgi:DNA-nicking Smr family endonuclease
MARQIQELDLHGVRHEDVPYTVKRFLEDILQTECDANYHIITGHSRRMKELVLAEIAIYGIFHFYFEPAKIVIYLRD